MHEGLEPNESVLAGLDEVVPFVHLQERRPSWHTADSSLVDVTHALSILAVGGDLIAVLVDGAWSDRLPDLVGPAGSTAASGP